MQFDSHSSTDTCHDINNIRNTSTNTISTMMTSCSCTSTNSSCSGMDSVSDPCPYNTNTNNNNSSDVPLHPQSLLLLSHRRNEIATTTTTTTCHVEPMMDVTTTAPSLQSHGDSTPPPLIPPLPAFLRSMSNNNTSLNSITMDDSNNRTTTVSPIYIGHHLHYRRMPSDTTSCTSSTTAFQDETTVSLPPPPYTPISSSSSFTTMTRSTKLRLNYSGAGRHLLHTLQQHQQRIRYRRKRRLAEYEAALLRRNHSSTTTTTTIRSRYIIPADHPMKLLWDFGTVIVSCIHAYKTHTAIRDRTFDIPYTNTLQIFLELWFVVDIVLNFITEHKLGTVTLRTISAISARYLTTWFVIDVLSLIPGEWLFVRPVIQRLKARGRIQKWFSRTKAITRVTTKLIHRWTILRQVSSVYRRQMGIGGVARLVRTCIRYIPKYILFLRNMKAVVAVRILRQWHWMRKVYYNIHVAMEALSNKNHYSHSTSNATIHLHNNAPSSSSSSSTAAVTPPIIAIQPCLSGSLSRSSSRILSNDDASIDSNDRRMAPVATPNITKKLNVPYPISIAALPTNTTMDTEMEEEETTVMMDQDGCNIARYHMNMFDDVDENDHDRIEEEDDEANEYENSRVILFQDSDHSNEEDDDEDVETHDDSYFYDNDDDEEDDDDSPY